MEWLDEVVKKSRNNLAVALAGAAVTDSTCKPEFVEQPNGTQTRRRRRRGPIQELGAERRKGTPQEPTPLALFFGDRQNPRHPAAGDNGATTRVWNERRLHRGGVAPRGCRAGASVRRGRGLSNRASDARPYWNETALDFIQDADPDLMLLAEMHLKRDKAKDYLGPVGRLGWDATIGPAHQSSKSEVGSNGGVAAAVHRRWVSSAWPDTLDAKGHVVPYYDLIGRTIRLGVVDFHALVACFACQEVLGGRNC